jgi:hypothetical protein
MNLFTFLKSKDLNNPILLFALPYKTPKRLSLKAGAKVQLLFSYASENFKKIIKNSLLPGFQ